MPEKCEDDGDIGCETNDCDDLDGFLLPQAKPDEVNWIQISHIVEKLTSDESRNKVTRLLETKSEKRRISTQ